MSFAVQTDSKLEVRYQFHGRIGAGGAGEVYSAWDTQLERTVAIKRLRTDSVSDDTISSTWKEAMRLAAVRHPNIVSVFDLGVDAGSPYIVMEFVQGETVDQRIAKGVMLEEDFVHFAQQALDALVAAHHAGLVHRDLKPSNLMLTLLPSGAAQVKVLDFGIAKFLTTPTEQTINIDGTITGSIHCVSPEQLNRDPVDQRSDLYSLGCVFYYALAGQYPFNGRRLTEVIQAHLNHQVEHLKRYRPELAQPICDWVMALINRHPEHRYQHSRDALAALQYIIKQTRVTPLVHPTANIATVQPATASLPASGEGNPPISLHPAGPVAHAADLPAAANRKAAIGWKIGASLPGIVAVGAVLWAMQANSGGGRRGALVQKESPPRTVEQVTTPEIARADQPAPAPVPIQPPATTLIPAAAAPIAPAPAPKPPETPKPVETVLRFAGSNTVGAKLLPALIEAFFRREGATTVEKKPGSSHEDSRVEGTFADAPSVKGVEIAAHGSATAFTELVAGNCEIGMASRAIKAEELEQGVRAGLGDLQSPACEHVIGLDGIAIVVHRGNPLAELSKAQVGDIFSGKITNWSQVGGTDGPIRLYARDAKSGTFDTFKSLVLGSATDLSGEAKRFEDSDALSDAVAADPAGIGFIGLPYVRSTKVLAVSEPGASPFLATRFTVATEDYVLSRRLYLYTPASPQNPMVSRFVEFALSAEGQEIVSKVGFVKQTMELQRPVIPPDASDEYRTATLNADRLSVNFRFRPKQIQLDNKALRDLDRITALMAEPKMQSRELVLLGFTDGKGTSGANLKLSRERARIVAQQLTARGMTAVLVSGLGAELPVASNETEPGRDKNRRVEVWVREKQGR